MQFTHSVEIDANTTKADPTRENIRLDYGMLKKVQIIFPWGCANYVGIRILHYEHVLYPTNKEEWFTGNEVSIEFECEYPIVQGIDHFRIEGYNEDDFYSHTPTVSFNVLPGQLSGMLQHLWMEG